MNKVISKVMTLLTFAVIASSANAALIWDNGSHTNNIGGYCSSCGAMDNYTMFDNFSLTNNVSDMVVDWDASFYSYTSTSRNVRVSVWSAYNSGQLWTDVFNFSELNLLSINNVQGANANLTVSAMMNGVNLNAGNYWISFSGDDMHFETNGAGNAGQVHSLGQGGNPQNLPELSFRLNSTKVPEPSGLILFGLGLACLAAGRRSQSRA